MSDKKFYIRFGLHRDRNMLRFLKDDYAGIVLPAHILAYSSKATIAALRYIDKPYFIDPMTYIYAKGFLEGYQVRKEEDQKDHLKPSIIKLTEDLALGDTFPEIDTKPLEVSDFTDELITKIAKGNLDLQLNRINKGMASSTPKLDELLAQIGLPSSPEASTYPSPIFLTAPYFLIPKEDTAKWTNVNVKLAKETKRLAPDGAEIRPIILTHVEQLNKALLDRYDGFDKFIVWVEDLDESKPSTADDQVKKLKAFKGFIEQASKDDRSVINLYGSYFSAILLKLGLEAFSNGPLYGEYKSSKASLGGIPPVRIYIPSIHRFYIYSQATELIGMYPQLFEDFPDGSKKLFKTVPELAKILGDVTLAQEHFINSRNQEIEYVQANSMDQIISSIKEMHDTIGPFEEKPLRGKEPHQLLSWAKALEEKPKQ